MEKGKQARIGQAEADFLKNLKKLKLNHPYIIKDQEPVKPDLESYFNLRVGEGLMYLLEEYLNKYAEWEWVGNAIVIKSWKALSEGGQGSGIQEEEIENPKLDSEDTNAK